MSASLFVPNFRDVGETINVLAGEDILKTGVLFRGGELGQVDDLEKICSPKTIINLRKGKDPVYDSATSLHLPAPDSMDVYLAQTGSNRKWIVSVLKAIADESIKPPFFIHCAAGKDRTGVMIGAILACLSIPRKVIAEDYELSTGLIHPELFSETLNAFEESDYFRKLDIASMRRQFLSGATSE